MAGVGRHQVGSPAQGHTPRKITSCLPCVPSQRQADADKQVKRITSCLERNLLRTAEAHIYVTAMKATPTLLGTRQELVTLKQHRLYLYLENQPAWGSQMNSLQLC